MTEIYRSFLASNSALLAVAIVSGFIGAFVFWVSKAVFGGIAAVFRKRTRKRAAYNRDSLLSIARYSFSGTDLIIDHLTGKEWRFDSRANEYSRDGVKRAIEQGEKGYGFPTIKDLDQINFGHPVWKTWISSRTDFLFPFVWVKIKDCDGYEDHMQYKVRSRTANYCYRTDRENFALLLVRSVK